MSFKDSLLSAAGNVFWALVTGQSPSDLKSQDEFWTAVKLIHADDLKHWACPRKKNINNFLVNGRR